MPKFRKKPVVIEAITFDELVRYGLATGVHPVDGVPWHFIYRGHHISHETDDCYLIPTLEGTMKFNRGDMLITGVEGEIYPCRMDIFKATYENASEAAPSPIDLMTTDDMVKELSKRNKHVLLCLCRAVTDKDDGFEFDYRGGRYAAIGMAEAAAKIMITSEGIEYVEESADV